MFRVDNLLFCVSDLVAFGLSPLYPQILVHVVSPIYLFQLFWRQFQVCIWIFNRWSLVCLRVVLRRIRHHRFTRQFSIWVHLVDCLVFECFSVAKEQSRTGCGLQPAFTSYHLIFIESLDQRSWLRHTQLLLTHFEWSLASWLLSTRSKTLHAMRSSFAASTATHWSRLNSIFGFDSG